MSAHSTKASLPLGIHELFNALESAIGHSVVIPVREEQCVLLAKPDTEICLPEEQEKLALRKEFYALASLLSARIWTRIVQWQEINPDAYLVLPREFGNRKIKGRKINNRSTAVSLERLLRLHANWESWVANPSPWRLIMSSFFILCDTFVHSYVSEREINMSKSRAVWSEEDHWYHRFVTLLERRKKVQPHIADSTVQHLAFTHGLGVIRDLLGLILDFYHTRFSGPIDVISHTRLGREARHFVGRQSKTHNHIELFLDTLGNRYLTKSGPSVLILSGEKPELALSINPEVINREHLVDTVAIREWIYEVIQKIIKVPIAEAFTQDRLTCPAAMSTGAGKNVVQKTLQQIQATEAKYLFEYDGARLEAEHYFQRNQ
ncbi:MAG: hypothetical protein HY817_05330 [Candidatus Abawacabacteria bacterium]|nr:hypothetical protein [Candidatus Abawacabacteria bacterium]